MLIIKSLICLLALQTPIEQWQRINTEQNLSILFPNHPQRLEKNISGMKSYIYQTKDESCVFGLVCTDFSTGKIPLNNETVPELYKQMKIASVSMENTILKNERTIPNDNMLIKEIEYSTMKGKNEMTYFKRFIFRDNIVYQISIGARTRHWDIIMKSKEIFFNSIYFKEE